jgi:hypothetical protein
MIEEGGEMKFKNIILGTAVSMCLGILSAIGFTNVFSIQSEVFADNDQFHEQKVSKALDVQEIMTKVPFAFKQPKELPFISTGSYAIEKKYGDIPGIEITYVDSVTEGYLTLRVVNGDVKPMSVEYTLESTKLKNGTQAQYLDNGAVQIIYWKQDGLSYSLVASKGNETMLEKLDQPDSVKYKKEELVNIADSLQ